MVYCMLEVLTAGFQDWGTWLSSKGVPAPSVTVVVSAQTITTVCSPHPDERLQELTVTLAARDAPAA